MTVAASLSKNPGTVYSIPFSSFAYQHESVATEIQEAITRVAEKNWFVLGDEVEKFESNYARYSGTAFCIGVGNGLDALTIALQSLNIGVGDEVIVPAHTYVATWLAVTRTGARIVPVEADQATLNIDVNRIETAITARTKVIIPAHLYGQPCDMTAIDRIARKHGLKIVEDNAQSQGAMWGAKRSGSFGDVNATSFYPTKNLGAWGDGGAITTHEEHCAKFSRAQRNYGSLQRNITIQRGFNSRLDELQAAILSVKLQKLDEWNNQRRALAARYLTKLTGLGDLLLPLSAKEAYHVYHQFVIRTHRRDELQRYLISKGVGTLIHYPTPPFLQPAYVDLGIRPEDFPGTVLISETALSLPIWPGMSADQIDFVSQQIKNFYG